MFRAALFDLDGVVFDTEPQYSVFWGSQCRLYHPEHPGLEHEIKGSTLDQIFDRWWSGPLEAERETLTQRLNDFEAQMHYDYIEGLQDFLAVLRTQGVRTAIVTSSNRQKMDSVYRSRPELRLVFDEILTSEDFTESKPSPQCYLRAAQRLGVAPEDCVVFEDSFNGLKSGRASGAYVVALATTNPAEAIAPYADQVINDFTQFTNLCKQSASRLHN